MKKFCRKVYNALTGQWYTGDNLWEQLFIGLFSGCLTMCLIIIIFLVILWSLLA